MADIIKFKRGTSDEWTASNVVLEEGEIGVETDTLKMKVGTGANAWNDIHYTTKEIDDEISRLKTDISTDVEPVFAWRGNGVPTLPTDAHKAYYIHIIVLKDSTSTITIPTAAPNGAIFSVENNDRTDYVTIYAPTGETINGSASYQCPFDTLNFFVKDGANWILAYGGVFPNSLTALKSTIQTILPNSLNTIPEIQAQLKDRLHTFREIQDEFTTQLHTYDDLEAHGFARAAYQYGLLSDQNVPHDDNSWILGEYPLNEEKIIPFQNTGDKYLAFLIPAFMTPLIKELQVNSTAMGFEDHDYIYNELHYTILITDSTITTGSNVRIKFEFGESGGGSSVSGIEFDDGTNDAASIVKVNLKGQKITELPSQGSMTSNEIEVTAGMDIHMQAPDQQYGNALCNELIVQKPLEVDDTPDGEFTARIYIDHDAYEPMHKPSFLAYLAEDEEVVGKLSQDEETTPKAHHDGSLWFDNIVWPAGSYIETDKTNKKYGIQEADQLDPNVTGGTDYLIAFRIHMKGNAPSDGFVRAYLYNNSVNPFEPSGYLEDKNGQLMAVQRVYKTGDELGSLDVIGVVNAKGLQEFSCHVMDSFSNDVVTLTDRTEGCTGLMIQAITSESKSGVGLLQFENDTAQNIEFSSHYLGADRMSMGYITSRPETPVSYTAGTHFIDTDGWRLINPNGIKVGVVDGHLHIQDDGVNMCDFNFGKVFSAEETHMLRGKDINVTATLVDKENGFTVALMKWTGSPDAYTPEIFTTRNNGSPILQTGWALSDNMFVSEDAVAGDHTQAKTFVVPSDANNYAIIIYPVEAQTPSLLKLKELKVDVDPAFIGYVLHAPELLGESHLVYDTEYKELSQDNQGYASLRYTINNVEVPMPVGELGKGAADVSLDTSVNTISGSSAKGGEGAIEFNTDGKATIHTAIRISSEKASGTTSRINFWYAKVIGESGSETYDEVAESEHEFDVVGGTKDILHYMPAFTVDVTAGDRLALRAMGDATDSAFIQSSSPSKPMVHTTITFKEITDASDDPTTGIDLSGFTTYLPSRDAASYEFTNQSTVSIPLTLPEGITMGILSVHRKASNGEVRPIKNPDYKYTPPANPGESGSLQFSFGAAYTGQIIVEFLS